MPGRRTNEEGPWGSRWRATAWGGAGALLLLPLAAMQVTDEVAWTPSDFALAALLLGVAGLAAELGVRRTAHRGDRAALAVALGTAVLLLWMNGAVGLIGSEDNPANLLFAGVLAIALVGAALARLRPRGMTRAMAATAAAQALAPVVALAAGLGSAESIQPLDVLALTLGFAGLWLLSAWLFHKAARDQAGATP